MIKDYKIIEKLEKDLAAKELPDIKRNYRIIAAMYEEAKMLGIFPLKNELDGIEIDIKIAGVLNSVPENS